MALSSQSIHQLRCNAREAMDFYKRVFGGSLELNTFGESGAKDSSHTDKIMHSLLETDNGFTLMCADTPPGMEHNPGNNIAVRIGSPSLPIHSS